MEDRISINLWHGGTFEVAKPKLRYVGGESKLIFVDVDKLYFFELVDYAMETGSYQEKNFIMYYFKLDDGNLKRLYNDQDVIDMGCSVSDKSTQVIDLYIQQGPIKKPTGQPIKPQAKPTSEPTKPQAEPTSEPTKLTRRYLSGSVCEGKLTARKSVPPPTVDQEIVDQDASDSDDSGSYVASEEDTYDDEDLDEVNESGSDRDDDEWLQSVVALKKVNEEDVVSKQVLFEECLKVGDEQQGDLLDLPWKDPVDKGNSHTESYSSYEDSDGEVNTPGESEDDDIRGRKYKEQVPHINDQTDWKKFIWVVGIRFPSRDAFKSAVRMFAVANGRNLYIARSDKNRQGRIGVKCVKGCPFSLMCSFHKGKECYMVKKSYK
jgi:hypothetical protein